MLRLVRQVFPNFQPAVLRCLAYKPHKKLSPEDYLKAEKRDADIRDTLNSLPVGGRDSDRKRALWRSRERGFLELDLLMDSFALEFVSGFDDAMMDQYNELLELDTLDIFGYITGQRQPSESVAANPIYHMFREYSREYGRNK